MDNVDITFTILRRHRTPANEPPTVSHTMLIEGQRVAFTVTTPEEADTGKDILLQMLLKARFGLNPQTDSIRLIEVKPDTYRLQSRGMETE